MAKYRQLHTTFWDDTLILDLTPEQKYFYIYLSKCKTMRYIRNKYKTNIIPDGL